MLSGHVVVRTPVCVRPPHAGRTPRQAGPRRSTLGHAAARPNVRVQQWARRICSVHVQTRWKVHAATHTRRSIAAYRSIRRRSIAAYRSIRRSSIAAYRSIRRRSIAAYRGTSETQMADLPTRGLSTIHGAYRPPGSWWLHCGFMVVSWWFHGLGLRKVC